MLSVFPQRSTSLSEKEKQCNTPRSGVDQKRVFYTVPCPNKVCSMNPWEVATTLWAFAKLQSAEA